MASGRPTGVISKMENGSSPADRKARDQLRPVAEAMRELRTNIQFMDVDNPPRAVVITSALPSEGKSTTASNLAITLAASGQQVILIDGDLRRPMVATIFGLPGEVGLTDVLAGRADIDDVTQPVGPQGRLSVIAAGRIPPNPSELLGSQRMRDLVRNLAKKAFVMVAAAGKTTIDALHKAQSNLDRAGGRALGLVLNRVPRRGAGSAYYGYQYTGDYYASSDDAVELPEDVPLVPATGSESALVEEPSARRAAEN